MRPTDARILRLIDLLIFQKTIRSVSEFCRSVEMDRTVITRIKNGHQYFTVRQIEQIALLYNVNANWIVGVDAKVFRSADSVEL